MSLPVVLTDAGSGASLFTIIPTDTPKKATGKAPALVTATIGIAFGTFKAATRTTAGTTQITTPDPGGSLIVTWIAVSGEKQPNSDVEVRFTDGTDIVTIVLISQVDAPPNLAMAFPSRVQGWKDARIDMITSGAGDATVSVGYLKLPTGLAFAEWDALR